MVFKYRTHREQRFSKCEAPPPGGGGGVKGGGGKHALHGVKGTGACSCPKHKQLIEVIKVLYNT